MTHKYGLAFEEPRELYFLVYSMLRNWKWGYLDSVRPNRNHRLKNKITYTKELAYHQLIPRPCGLVLEAEEDITNCCCLKVDDENGEEESKLRKETKGVLQREIKLRLPRQNRVNRKATTKVEARRKSHMKE